MPDILSSIQLYANAPASRKCKTMEYTDLHTLKRIVSMMSNSMSSEMIIASMALQAEVNKLYQIVTIEKEKAADEANKEIDAND
jgi:hypothetical protein